MKEVLKMTEHKFNGLLFLDENDLSRMNYKVKDINGVERSITDILDTIYNNTNSSIYKLIRVVGKFRNNKSSFNKFQQLHITKDKYGTQSYHIDTFPLENQLYKTIGQEIDLVIEDYTDATRDIGLFYSNPYSDIGGTTEGIYNDTSQIS
jgi:hypothetical protein